MMKSLKAAVLDAIGITALREQLSSIENNIQNNIRDNMTATNQVLAEQELRAAGWYAASTNRQLKLEQTFRNVEVSLQQITKQIESGAIRDEMRLQELNLELHRLGQLVKQVRDSDQELN